MLFKSKEVTIKLHKSMRPITFISGWKLKLSTYTGHTYIWYRGCTAGWFPWISFFPACHLIIGTGKNGKSLLVFVTLLIICKFATIIFPAISVKIKYCEKATYHLSLPKVRKVQSKLSSRQASILPKKQMNKLFFIWLLFSSKN